MKKQIIALGALVFLAACSDQSENIAKVDETTPSTTEPTTEPAPTVPTTDSTTATTGDPESSASESNADTPPSSSSFTMPCFSSSSYPGDLPMLSSSSFAPPVPESSSTLDMPRGEIGTCAPVTNPIKTGESVRWKFTLDKANVAYSAIDLVRAKYEWTFDGETLDDGSASTTLSGNIQYFASGLYEASLIVIMSDGMMFKVQCSPLQVYDQAVIDLHPAN